MLKTKTSKRPKPPKDYDDNPEWSTAQIRSARPAREVSPLIVAEYEKKLGRPSLGDAAKAHLSLRIAPDVLRAYQKTGKGWQTRMNEVLARGAKKLARAK
jgi:uncharacterized protein (DUF4415 family)